MLSIIYGEVCTGKTTYIYNEINRKYDENIKNNVKSYLIVPEQFNLITEEKLINHIARKGLFNVEVLTFKRMAYRIFSLLSLDVTRITDVGAKIIIYKLINENNYEFFNKSNKGTIEKLLDIFSEFGKYDITVEKLENIKISDILFKRKINEIKEIYDKYTKKIIDSNLYYQSELLILDKYILDCNIKNCDIYIDEFYGFTQDEYNIICKLAQYNNVIISFCIDSVVLSDNPLHIYNPNILEYINFIDFCKKKNVKINKIKEIKNDYNNKNELVYLRENLFSYPCKPFFGEAKNISIYSCNNQYAEILNLARNIKQDILNGIKYNEIAVITRNIEKYSNYIWAIFSKYNIPYFFDIKNDINNNPISQLIFSIIDIYITNFNYESIFAYLKTGFLDIDIDDIYYLENYVIKWNIKGYKWFRDFKYDDEYLDKLNIIRQKIIEPLNSLKSEFKISKTIKQITFSIYNFLEMNNIKKEIEKKITDFNISQKEELFKEYSDIWNYYIDLFNQLILSIGQDEVTLIEYKNILEIGLENTQKGYIPLYKDCILIGDVDRTRINEIKSMYIIGMQNDKFPIVYGQDGILSDENRQEFKDNNCMIAKTSKEKIEQDQFDIYKMLSMAKNKVCFSYICNDLDGVTYRPSYLLNKIKKMFNLKEISVDNNFVEFKNMIYDFSNMFENNLEMIKWYMVHDIELFEKYKEICKYNNKMENTLNEQNTQVLYGDIFKGSVSKIEEYAKCPYSFYLKYGLNIKQRESFEIRNLDIGNFNHLVLDEFFKYIIENVIDILNLSKEEVNELSLKIINSQFDNLKISMIKESKKINFLKIKLMRTLQKAIWILVLQIKQSSFRPITTEAEFGKDKEYNEISFVLDNGKKVELTGKIDRIDIADTKDGKYVRIIDYKSSNKDVKIPDIYKGINLQLITYLDAVTENDSSLIPGGILYFKIDNPIIKTNHDITEEEVMKEIMKQLRLKGLILNDKLLISHMDNNIKDISNLINIKINSEGVSKNKNVIMLDEFKSLQKKSKQILVNISNEILSGKINVSPYWNNKDNNACMYCNFNAICKFDKSKCHSNN